MDHGERESYIRENIASIAEEAFPDNEPNWKVHGVQHRGEFSRVDFEADPHPPEAAHGASVRFLITLDFSSGAPEVLAAYELVDRRFRLLFGKDPMKDEVLP